MNANNNPKAGLCLITALLLTTVLCAAQGKTNLDQKTKTTTNAMSAIQKNKEVIRKIYEESLNKRNIASLQELIADEYIGFNGVKGAAGFQTPTLALIKAFPDAQWYIEELLGEGDRVVIKWRVEGTHKDSFQNIPATGNKMSINGIGIYELKDGKVTAVQVQTDRFTFMQQINVLPADVTVLQRKQLKDRVSFIDKFLIPAAAKQEFYERMNINRTFIKSLPGFIEDAAYEYTDANGNLICVTVALWESREALVKAKEAVQAEYKKQGFDGVEMLKRLNIVADRGIYTPAGNP
jgi:steroid delta-isomerase-like uncharacterized protein